MQYSSTRYNDFPTSIAWNKKGWETYLKNNVGSSPLGCQGLCKDGACRSALLPYPEKTLAVFCGNCMGSCKMMNYLCPFAPVNLLQKYCVRRGRWEQILFIQWKADIDARNLDIKMKNSENTLWIICAELMFNADEFSCVQTGREQCGTWDKYHGDCGPWERGLCCSLPIR